MRAKLNPWTVNRSQVRLMNRSEVVIPSEPVADAWYAAGCVSGWNPRQHLLLGVWLPWLIRKTLRRAVPSVIRRAFKRLTCSHRWVPEIVGEDPSIAWCFHCQATRKVA